MCKAKGIPNEDRTLALSYKFGYRGLKAGPIAKNVFWVKGENPVGIFTKYIVLTEKEAVKWDKAYIKKTVLTGMVKWGGAKYIAYELGTSKA